MPPQLGLRRVPAAGSDVVDSSQALRDGALDVVVLDDSELPAPNVAIPAFGADRLIRLAALSGAALVAIQAVYLLFVLCTGLALTAPETLLKANGSYRIGLAFSSHVGVQTSLALALAVLLLAVPAAGRSGSDALATTRSISLVLAQVLAVMIVVGSVLAVRSTVFFLPPLSHHLSSAQRWELASYFAGTAGPAFLCLVAAVAAMPRLTADTEPA